MDQKLGFKFSLSAQESPSHSFNFLFEEDSTSECSSDVAQDIPLPELLLLGTESDRECSFSQFSPPKAAQVKPLGNMFPEASSFATSSQGEGPLSEALAILKTQQTTAFSPSTEIAYRRALDYLFENKPIWEPPSPDDKILVPNTPSPQRKKVVSGLLLSERHKTSRTWSLGDPLEDISSREPSPSGAHEALAPEAFLSTKVTVYEFPPTEPVSPPSTSLDVLFEDTSIHEFSSQIHEVAPEFPAAVRKKPVYEFSPSKVRPLPSQRSLDFLLEDQAAFEPSSQAHDSDFSESPPLVAKKLVFEVSPQASPGPSSPDFLFEDDIPGSSYPSFLLDDDILRPSSHDFLLDDELPGPSYRSYLLDDELPGPSYRSYLIDDELPGPSYRSYLIDDELPGPSYRSYLTDDELPGPSYRSYLIDDELPGPSYRSYLIDDEVPGPSSSSFLVEEEKARFSSPDFPIEEEETLDYTSLLYNRSVSPHPLGKKSVFAPSPNTCSAQTIPYIDSLNFLIDDKSAGEPLSQAQEMLSSESPMLGRKLGYEFKPLDLLFEEGSSPEAASIPIHSLVIPATSPGEKYLPQYKSPDFMYEDPSAFQYFPSGVHDLVFPDMTSGIDNYGSQFASSRAQIVTSPSSLDFLFQDQLTGDPSSPDPVILLPGSPDSVGERPIFEFFSSQEEKTFCDSTSDQGRLFYDVPLSQNQELEPESSFRAEQRVAEAFSSHVFFPFEEEMMPVGGDLTSQVSEEQVYECSSTCMPESTDTEATPPQESDDDDDEEEDDNDEDVSNDEDGEKDHDKDSGKDDSDRDDGGGDDGGDGDDEDGGDGGKKGDDGSKEGGDEGKEGGDEGKEGGDEGKEGGDGGKEGGNGGKEDGGNVNKDSGDIDENGSNVGDKDGGNINKDSSDVDKDCGNGNDVDKDSSDGSDINKDDGDNKDGGDNTDDDNKDDSYNKDGSDNTDDDNKDDSYNKDGGDNTDDNDKDDNKDGSNKTDNDKDDNDNKDDRDNKDDDNKDDNKDEKDDEDDEDNKALPMWKETI
ncbi:uncharacterized protein LOC127543227 [Antechinus flavipes]|uniref:uncharacterized protein LOC127543227 n=1 Tax=Antechinus flavipes TaxID=38775 RepID=UPI002235AFAF|nr:uncharacterized protein LOC127543227 [Antechinus flavipes]